MVTDDLETQADSPSFLFDNLTENATLSGAAMNGYVQGKDVIQEIPPRDIWKNPNGKF